MPSRQSTAPSSVCERKLVRLDLLAALMCTGVGLAVLRRAWLCGIWPWHKGCGAVPECGDLPTSRSAKRTRAHAKTAGARTSTPIGEARSGWRRC